jgi:hypothetical protein
MLSLITNFTFANETTPKSSKRADQPIEIKVVPWGPTEKDANAARRRVEQSAAVQNALKGTKHRLIGFNYIEESATNKSLPSRPPTRYRVFFYDYTNDRTVIAESDFAGKESIKVNEEFYDPGVVREEFDAAFELVKRDSEFKGLSNLNKLELFEPMPPISNLKGERLVNIGVRNLNTGESQIVGVSFKNDKVVRYENNAPLTARVAPESCGITNASQPSTTDGVAGQYQVSVLQNDITLWEILVIRPSSSSGRPFERSGIEIRDVKYKGKSVIKRGHVPVLNVKYINDVCGPFRDWQFQEGFFNAPPEGADNPAPGIRILAQGQIATTAVESRNDTGNFQGVAIYRQNVGFGNEVVMVSEMNAGHYRYIMEWRFAADGTIRPRYGFGSVVNECTCAPRTHHVYWRFDFDIVNPTNKIFQVERGRKFIKPVTTESAIFRSYQLKRGFLIQNSSGDEAYQITPNPNDGAVTNAEGVLTDTFGAGDFWFLRFKGTADSPDEIDDPNPNDPDPNLSTKAALAPWVNGESLVNQDAVVWYAAHQYRVDDASRSSSASPEVLQGRHVVGPDLRPVRW